MAVFDVLGDPRSYADWVVGSSEVRAADREWPAEGSALHHSVGAWPLVLKDKTTVVRARAPVMLELRARARPLPSMCVTLRLQPDGKGTRLTMVEDPANALLNLLAGPFGHLAVRIRNRESLRRLRALTEGT